MNHIYSLSKFSLPLCLILTLFSGCGGCGKADPKKYFSDSDVIALTKAAQRGDVKTIDRLVEKGVDVNAKGKENVTPLQFALQARNKKGFLRLLEHGADPNIQNDRGSSVISIAAGVEEDSEFLEMVLKHKGNPNLVNSANDIIYGGRTPLFDAIRSRNSRNVALLIKAGANPNHKDKDGLTPLMFAAESRCFDFVLTMLNSGADWKIQYEPGMDLAYFCLDNSVKKSEFPEKYRDREKVLQFLRDKGVDLEATQRFIDERKKK